jgi:UDP-2,3-diacylglucosamine hydrolase
MPRDLAIVIADAHLSAADDETRSLVECLATVGPTVEMVILLGDLFALWVAHQAHTAAHHQQVLEQVRRLRQSGTKVVFLEGNREFGVGRWRSGAFDHVGYEFSLRSASGESWLFTHGHQLDSRDRRTHLLHRCLRSGFVLTLLGALPAGWLRRLGDRLERRFRQQNLRYKTAIDHSVLESFLQRAARAGVSHVVIGHLHLAVEVVTSSAGQCSRLIALPDWRSTHCYLRIASDGSSRSEQWGTAPDYGVPIVAVEEHDASARLQLAERTDWRAGQPLVITSGHGSGLRQAVVRRSGDGALAVEVELGPGAPVQVGDRVAARR